MTNQPEALRLADKLAYESVTVQDLYQAAEELRRLHEEVKYNAALERVLEKQCTEILRLHEVNQKLVEALKWAVNCLYFSSDMPEAVANLNKAYQAIAKATGDEK